MKTMRDIFICHASEDKSTVVRPLNNAFQQAGISCWVDEAEINWGDSITQKVNEGLRLSRFVIVVLSEAFPDKPWPERELNAVLNIEASTSVVKVLPLLVGNKPTRDRILHRYPLLNDKFYQVWEGSPAPIVEAAIKRLSSIPEGEVPARTNQPKRDLSSVEIPIPRMKKRFTQRDKDIFLKEAFAIVKDYFQRALTQLTQLSPEVETDFTEIHAFEFIAKIYVQGENKNQCKVWIGGLAGSDDIGYSEGRSITSSNNSYNEIISIADDGFELKLKFTIGGVFGRTMKDYYTPEEAAEELWRRFSGPLEGS
jgi:hypothetical protein